MICLRVYKPLFQVTEVKSNRESQAGETKDNKLEAFIPLEVDEKSADKDDEPMFVPSAYLQMDNLFPDETALRVKRKAAKKAKRRDAIKMKKRKVDTSDAADSLRHDNGSEVIMDTDFGSGKSGVGVTTVDGGRKAPSTTYKYSCSRFDIFKQFFSDD